MSVGSIFFTAPYILLALLALPILWILLRAVPPAPIRHLFPAVALLIGLKDEDTSADRTPWWLLLLRMLAVAAVIVGLAAPVLNPQGKTVSSGSQRLLVVLDASWASAADWAQRQQYLERVLKDAAQDERVVALLSLTRPEPVEFLAAQTWVRGLAGVEPESWEAADVERVAAILPEGDFDTLWSSDGLMRESKMDLLALFEERGSVEVIEGRAPLYALSLSKGEERGVGLNVKRLRSGNAQEVVLQAIGPDPAGVERVLDEFGIDLLAGENELETSFALPAELQARVTRFAIKGAGHAGAVVLTDDSLRRRDIALVDTRINREGLELLSPLHYIEKALSASANIRSGSLEELLPAKPDVVILADIAELTETDEAALKEWVNEGGLLVRFAGPRLAASEVSREEEHPLMPVRLRAGGRFVGGAMSWGEPKTLAEFERGSPFFGLNVDDELSVSAQVVAQPDPQLAERVIARLSDGTPLVTRKALGQGEVVLFHISANAEWSNLPLSGLFVRMLERLSVAASSASLDMGELEGTIWNPVKTLDGFGRLKDAKNLSGVAGPDLMTKAFGPELQPGLYEGPGRRVARNVIAQGREIEPASWPASVIRSDYDGPRERVLGGPLFALGLLALALDILATLLLSGRLRQPAMAVFALLLCTAGTGADAQDEQRAISATDEIVLAHVLTGDARIDEVARAGLVGLSDTLFFRTSIEPNLPQSVDLERDELAFYPMLYWPVSPDQASPSEAAYTKLNAYLRAGGLILFDTRDSDVARFGAASPAGRALRRLAGPLDIPELEPLPEDHVLTRTFYLLQDYPGRHGSRDVWVEASPPEATRAEGMPFRNLNDGVTPVVIGGNDWAAAWAVDARGAPLLPIGRGFSGERQRELAFRFGVNLVMHVLTGNYKSDQVHVPALLERLGQ
ncbi:DUF4159 domain-containing protein [Lentibacter sp. XHP0401]|uniref:DUF4159 domain-containing protein n=1 Tax=Lentibacter sp. XHP0401 TaxID=2984334 RepID=UPI0021E6E226|nr:DUF4159 domain-containing protein [Lentibacter sp. XHP0401]MCV2892424.1 DUF4159 domain-containing protein [Lentibacter sp. XHP0401]